MVAPGRCGRSAVRPGRAWGSCTLSTIYNGVGRRVNRPRGRKAASIDWIASDAASATASSTPGGGHGATPMPRDRRRHRLCGAARAGHRPAPGARGGGPVRSPADAPRPTRRTPRPTRAWSSTARWRFRAPGDRTAAADARLIVRAGIGYDLIDVAAATRRGIWVANVPDYCADEVADHAMLLLLAATRRLDALAGRLAPGRPLAGLRAPAAGPPAVRADARAWWAWAGSAHAWRPARGRSAGASSAAIRLLPAERIRRAGAEPVDARRAVRAESDAITLHCPLSAETHHLVNAERLAATQARRGHRQHQSGRPDRPRSAGRRARIGAGGRRRPGRAGGRADARPRPPDPARAQRPRSPRMSRGIRSRRVASWRCCARTRRCGCSTAAAAQRREPRGAGAEHADPLDGGPRFDRS